MTMQQKALARHALGLPNRRHRAYRNWFVAGPGHADYAEWMAMVDRGYALHRDGDNQFWLTAEGMTRALQVGESWGES